MRRREMHLGYKQRVRPVFLGHPSPKESDSDHIERHHSNDHRCPTCRMAKRHNHDTCEVQSGRGEKRVCQSAGAFDASLRVDDRRPINDAECQERYVEQRPFDRVESENQADGEHTVHEHEPNGDNERR